MVAACHGVTLATHGALPNGAPDDQLLAAELRHRGTAVRFAVWNDPGVDWGATPLTVIRSTWDYYQTPARWAEWIAATSAATTLANSPAALQWSSDKRYLVDLAERGVPCVPTELVGSVDAADPAWCDAHLSDTRGARLRESLAAVARRRGWHDVVVKPAVAASSFGARRFASDSLEGEAHLQALLSRGPVLVQPYLAALEHQRERSLVYVGGAYRHAFTKPAFSTNATGTTAAHLHEPSRDECALADTTLAMAQAALAKITSFAPQRHVLAEPLLYARVDVVPTPTGLLLMELELVEPDLALRLSAKSIGHFADAVTRALAMVPTRSASA